MIEDWVYDTTRDENWTYIGLHGDLRQIDLIRQMLIRHAILIPLRLPPTIDNLHQTPHVPIERHLQIDAETPIERRAWTVHVQIRQSDLDDPCELLARLLVVRDSDPMLVSGADLGSDRLRDGGELGLGEIEESVAFARVHVLQWDTWFGGTCRIGGV